MDTVSHTLRRGLGDDRPAAYSPARDGVVLLGRILLALLFIWSGSGQLMGFDRVVGAIAGKGLPLPQVLAAASILIELGGGAALLLGWKARWAALFLALFIVIITPIFHNFWALSGSQAMMQKITFFKNLSILGGMLVVYGFGPGRYSLDRA